MGSTGETQTTPTEVSDEELSLFITQLASGSTLQMVLMASIELDLFKIIAKAGPGASVSPSYIASQLITSNPDTAEMLDRILRFLASHSILTYAQKNLPDGEVQHLYGLKPVCKYLIENEDGASIGPLCLLNQNKVLMESWYHLKDAVLNGGIPFNKAHGMSFDEYFSADKKFNQAYNKGMAAYSTFTMKNILETYKGFEDVSSVVHVGGGHGALLRMIVSKYPSIKGINFDLPHVIRDAPQIRGVEHVEADMYVSVPAAGAVFMKWICYNWYDERCVKFLKNCYDVLPENGKVIVAEWIRPVAPDSSLATKGGMNIDVIMMAQNPGGKVRTEKEFEALAKDAGFQGFRVMCNAFGTYVMEFLKKPVY